MATDGGLGEAESSGEIGDGRRPVIQDRPRHPVARRALTGREFLHRSRANVFHNAIVA